MVCAADAAGEKSVTCKDHLVCLVVETHAARSMSRSGNHLKLSIAELDNLPILQRSVEKDVSGSFRPKTWLKLC